MSDSETFWDYVDPNAVRMTPFLPAEEPSFSLHEARLELARFAVKLAADEGRRAGARFCYKNKCADHPNMNMHRKAKAGQRAAKRKQPEDEEEEEEDVEMKDDTNDDKKEDE
ncbi:hypothetical protein LTR10_011595 [Elasticomyces elasticus]|uniref:Uncharacterized protein n=1 Tax=Exophiala sideris TaxID=1016849 RepID=A0ABR0JDP5_9EURO|nr:hypothetical protein LTR10_011595 [Elasticomyces elasticus]KAK5031946.1 hypothetical protein LTS07_004567 [Exophiala sideris]KAK5040875.1 hypothetical protein LTR13_003176 [Exophiala sideris]KAK5061790.1 hypothetical protein LTR69_004973 [Exophiala sideris]KAK5184490.1 hypothetical protein LTR44_003164 [Eurotiomycetes sp. CCFEE 6388]